MARLRITEIFYSLQGESRTVGLPTVFIRLTGCPLRCNYCDTEYAFKGGQWMALDAILEQVAQLGTQYVTVTGGEPLAQASVLPLMEQLCDTGYKVSLESSGALDIASVDSRVMQVMDLKTPASGEQEKNLWSNLQHLKLQDQIKFVICDENDYRWAVEQLKQHDITARCEVLFSPALGQQDATQLAEWILRDHLPVRFQFQLHKFLWGDVSGK